MDFVIDHARLLKPGWFHDRPCAALSEDHARFVIALHERVSYRPIDPDSLSPIYRYVARRRAAGAALPRICELDARVPPIEEDEPPSYKQRPILGVIERFDLVLAERDALLACTLARYDGDDEAHLQRSWDALITQATATLDAMANALTRAGAPCAGYWTPYKKRPARSSAKFQNEQFLQWVTRTYPDVAADAERIHHLARAIGTLRNQIHEGPLIQMADLNKRVPVEVLLSHDMYQGLVENFAPYVANFGLRSIPGHPSLDTWKYCEALTATIRHILETIAAWWISQDDRPARWSLADYSIWLREYPVPYLAQDGQ